RHNGLVSPQALIENSVIVPPCYIGPQAVIRNSVVGPHVSVGDQSVVESAIVTNSILQNRAHIKNALLDSSMIGNSSIFSGSKDELNLGDFSRFSRR
ncbi:MAG TPA: nucleotidyltransferase, partial [Saprospiraceae bacterium]|nr:nucleotidyltransferase [Saprospiraceae bacterium]